MTNFTPLIVRLLWSEHNLFANMNQMLDDVNHITDADPNGALQIIANQWQQLDQNFVIPDLPKPDQIVLVGMGGSALGGLANNNMAGA